METEEAKMKKNRSRIGRRTFSGRWGKRLRAAVSTFPFDCIASFDSKHADVLEKLWDGNSFLEACAVLEKSFASIWTFGFSFYRFYRPFIASDREIFCFQLLYGTFNSLCLERCSRAGLEGGCIIDETSPHATENAWLGQRVCVGAYRFHSAPSATLRCDKFLYQPVRPCDFFLGPHSHLCTTKFPFSSFFFVWIHHQLAYACLCINILPL